MDALSEARNDINRIDEAMAALFSERMEAAGRIAAYKKEHGLAVFDAKREAEVIENNAQRIKDDELRALYVEFLRHLMDLSKTYQRKKIGEK